MKMDDIKQGLSSLWESVADGWEHIRQSASGALTRFRPGEQTDLPASHQIDDAFYMPSMGWSMLGGDLYEDEQRIVVRLELPGLSKDDIDIRVEGERLVVSGEKRFTQEHGEGRYRMLQCAYGSFQRSVPLAVGVLADEARARYENGVLRIELPKEKATRPQPHIVKVD